MILQTHLWPLEWGILGPPPGNFFSYCSNIHLNSDWILVVKVKGQGHSDERDTPGRPGGNFITSGTNVHLDLRMN